MTESMSLGDRMKRYEGAFSHTLPRRIPVIIRVDGKAFHTFTRRRFGRGWSAEFSRMMAHVALSSLREIQGCSLGYVQSDEISFLLTDYRTISTDAWFGNEINKMVSVSASLASSVLSQMTGDRVQFDSRAFSVPQDEVCNYFIWRQRDATRNAILMAGQEYYSHNQLHGKSCTEIQEMLFTEKGVNFNDYPVMRKRGIVVIDDGIVYEPPSFSEDRGYIESKVYIREDE